MAKKSPDSIAHELATLLPQMMMQMVRLGDALPGSAADLTPQQLRVITALDHAGAALRMSDLATRLGITQSTVTDASKRLIKLGYLERKRSLKDDRVVHLSLSDQGKSAARDLKLARIKVFEKICEKLGPKERLRLLASHQFILDTYRKLPFGE